MERNATRDLVVGLFVLAGLGALAYLSVSVGGLSISSQGGLKVWAHFQDTAGLRPRAAVLIGGVKVGQVTAVTLDANHLARVEMDLDPNLSIPADSSAAIVTAGILGDRYVSIEVGTSSTKLKSGDAIARTESALVLEKALGRLLPGGAGAGTPGAAKGGLKLYAVFEEIGGLKPKAPVVIAGVTVGQVTGITLHKDYRARVDLDLDPDLKLPTDTGVSIVTSGLMGERYLSLQVGGDQELLRSGEQIGHAESALILERLLGKLLNSISAPAGGDR